jgi:hypothetical protein
VWYFFDRLERVTYKEIERKNEALESEGDAQTLKAAKFTPAGMGNTAPFKPQPLPAMGSYTNKIRQRLRDRRYDFLLSPKDYDGTTKDINHLVQSWIGHDQPITVFDLAGVPPEIMDLVVGLLSRVLFEVMFWGASAIIFA